MSHLNERSQKNCLNCNASVHGRYCHICGQENIETFETAWHLVAHFFKDITHFDGKFFSSLRYLVFKPGFLSREYMIGRRASYLNPVRMYVFTSAIFFLVFFTFFVQGDVLVQKMVNGKTINEINAMDSERFSVFTKSLNQGSPMTREQFRKYGDSLQRKNGITFGSAKYKSREEYDSLIKHGIKKHNWLARTMTLKQFEINEKYGNDQTKITNAFVDKLVHSFPQILFISLPIFALILKLLYMRQKQYYYASHAIFSIHFYVYIFITFFLLMALSKIKTLTGWDFLNYVMLFTNLTILFYEYKAMRSFYAQRRGKTVLKFILLNLIHFLVLLILFILFTFFSLLKI